MMNEPTKLFGTYPQRQEGLFMQRIPIFAGVVTPLQLRELAQISINFTNSSPLHLTTRQDIELHNIPQDKRQAVLDRLEAIGFSTFGAGGDNIRNITVCPCCEYNPSAYHIYPLAEHLRGVLKAHPLRNDMPRKFKISFAGCNHPQTRPFVNDLSFIATSKTTVRVIGAGSLGAKPETGIVLYNQIAVNDVAALTLATITLFNEHADRQNRRKARLRHIRQRLGDQAFLDLLHTYFLKEKENNTPSQTELTKGRKGWHQVAALQTVAGDLDVQHALALAQAAAAANAHIHINFHHGLDIYACSDFKLPEALKELSDLPRVVACPGNSTCTNGLTNCPPLAVKLSRALRGNVHRKDKTIAISGCSNNCAHSAIANIGLIGRQKTIDRERQEVYQVLLNGDNGVSDKLAEPGEIVPAKDLAEYLSSVRF